MSLGKDDIQKVARLARLHISDAQAADMQGEINNILAWIGMLDEVDTQGLKPLVSVSGEALRWRDDAITDTGDSDLVLKNAPDPISLDEGGFYTVPKVVE
ncbi:MAG: Asp-tRNA(Asn)/Glu-tRNA(Gln) amidotransferase subunit GatC [Pseudomonadota bacterium]